MIIIVVVNVTPTLTSSSRIGRPITCGPADVDVTVGAAAAELFNFRSVPPALPWAAAGALVGVVASLPPPLSWRQGPTTMTTKTVAPLSRRRGRRRGEDVELGSSRLGQATAEGPPACRGGTCWATAAGLLVACRSEGDRPVHHGLVRHHVHPRYQQGHHDRDEGGRRALLLSNPCNAADLRICNS
jgi:hypothetical protein